MLTCAVHRSNKRSLIDLCAVSGPVPCSGARRLGKGLDEVSTAIHGGAAAVNKLLLRRMLLNFYVVKNDIGMPQDHRKDGPVGGETVCFFDQGCARICLACESV